MDTINEKTTATLELAFYDQNATLSAPDNATFELYDKFSGTLIRSGTISALTSQVDFETLTTDNTLIDQTNRYEIRVIEFHFLYSTRVGRGVYEYQVNNLSYLT